LTATDTFSLCWLFLDPSSSHHMRTAWHT